MGPRFVACGRLLTHCGRLVAVMSCLGSAVPLAAQRDKAAEDPTKIATKVGVSYSGSFSVSGSLAVGPKFKFNGRLSESGMWSVGASYLFPIAILTVAASRSELDTGLVQTRYSLGGFAPLARFGLKTGKWQLFVPFGYTYTNGKQSISDVEEQDGTVVDLSSNSGYVGLFVMRPLTEELTLTGGGNFTKGTGDFKGVALFGGLSYHLTARDTLGISASYIDNSFGRKEKVSVSYRHEF